MKHQTAISRRQFCLSSVALAVSQTLPGCASQAPSELEWSQADAIVAGLQSPQIPKRRFHLSDYDPQPQDILPALQAAIKACQLSGGGILVVPSGQWQVQGPIHFVSHMELHLSQGCELIFSGDAEHYLPAVFTRWEGTEAYNYSPFIYGIGLTDIAITGQGKINGQGKVNFLPWRKQQKPDQKRLRDMGRDGIPLAQRVFGAGHHLRPQFIQFVDCQRLLIEDVHIVDSPFWVVHPVYCRHVQIRGISVVSDHINSDGVDIDSCEQVLVERCNFNVGDDGVAIKAGRDQDGWRVARPSRHIVIRDCVYSGTAGGGMAIGSEMSGGVSDVYVQNYRCGRCQHLLYFKANLDRGGVIENVFIENIYSDYAESAIIFTNDYHSYRGGNFPTRFQQVHIRHLHCKEAKIALHIVGHASAPVRYIKLEHVTVEQAEVVSQIRHTEHLEFAQVRVNQRLLQVADVVDGRIRVAPSH